MGLKCVSRSVVSNSLLDPKDCSPPGFFVHGTLQARILEWVAMPSPGDLPDPGIKPRSPALPADSLSSESRLGVGWGGRGCGFINKDYRS